jgi:Spirocyclase AveC-like
MAVSSRPQIGVSAVPAARRSAPAVAVWAFFGALVLAFETFVLARWISGRFFKEVPSGPSDPPTWMKVALVSIQAVLPLVTIALLYRLVVRPWRRERRVGVDGVMALAFLAMCWQDPLSNYLAPWFTYNSWQINFGSWVNSLPGAMSFAQPGRMTAAPILYIVGIYVPAFLIVTKLGSWAMRTAQSRWPRVSRAELIGICFLTMMVYDFVLEGALFMPLGVFTYAGGHLALFPDTYHKYPFNEVLTTATMFTIIACVRYFVDDRGRTVVERGIDRVRGSELKKLMVRVLAMTAVVQGAMFFTYNVPNMWVSLHSTTWPDDIQKRSYFTDYICGDGTDRACPGPAVPHVRNDSEDAGRGSAYLTGDGRLGVPPKTTLPNIVPFERAKPGG